MSAAAAAGATQAPPGLPRLGQLDPQQTHPQELLLSAPGPHGHARFDGSITTAVGALTVRLTVPVPAGAKPPEGALDFAAGSGENATHATAQPTEASPSSSSWPAVLHFSGFQCVADQYAPLASRLATHGYACVQYTLPRAWPAGTKIVADEIEIAALPEVWAWAAARGAAASVRLDVDRVAAAGHSRGGKLAALHYGRQWAPPLPPPPPQAASKAARHCRLGGRHPHTEAPAAPPSSPPLPRLRALFLADPVDNTPVLARRGYPSGVGALRAAARAARAEAAAARKKGLPPPAHPPPTFGLACAGRFGGGNPMGSNWLEFLSAAPPGARSLLLHSAGHATFLQIPPDGSVGARALDLLFGGGPAPRPLVMALTAGAMLAWLRREGLAMGASAGGDAEEARWLAAVARAAERAAALAGAAVAGSAAGGSGAAGGGGGGGGAAAARDEPPPPPPPPPPPVMVQVSAEVKLGAGPSGEEGEVEEEGEDEETGVRGRRRRRGGEAAVR